MGSKLTAGVLTLLLLGPAAAAAQQADSGGIRFGNAGFGGSQSLTDSRTTGAEFSGGTPGDVGFDRGSIFGRDGLVFRTGEICGDSAQRLTGRRTTGAEGSGGTPSRTGGAGGAADRNCR